MMQNQKDTINHAIGKFMALGFLNPDDIDSQMIAAAKPIEELVDGLNAEVERLDQEVKTLTAERERLNKALEQMHKLVLTRYDSRFEVAPDGTSDVYGVEYFDDGEATYNERLPELAQWLRDQTERP